MGKNSIKHWVPTKNNSMIIKQKLEELFRCGSVTVIKSDYRRENFVGPFCTKIKKDIAERRISFSKFFFILILTAGVRNAVTN